MPSISTSCPEKKHPEHYRLLPEEGISNFNHFDTIIFGTTGHQMTV